MNNFDGDSINHFIESKIEKTKIFTKNLYKKYNKLISFDEISSIVQFYLVTMANDKKMINTNSFDAFLYKRSNWEILNNFRSQRIEARILKLLCKMTNH
jgi:hypothetical protein